MKAKKAVIAGITLLIIGVIVFICGMSALKWDFYALDTNVYEEHTFTAEGDINKLVLNVDSFNVTLVKGDVASITYYTTKTSDTTVEEADGAMTVNTHTEYDFFKEGMFQLKRLKYKFVVTVPETVRAVEADVTDLSMELSDFSFDAMNMKVTNLNLTLNGCNITTVDLDCVNSNVNAENSVFNSLSIKSTNADIKIGDSKADAFVLDSVNVDAIVNLNADSVDIKSTNADVFYNGAVENFKIHAVNLSGKATVNGTKSDYTVNNNGNIQEGATSGKSVSADALNYSFKIAFSE